MCPGVISFLSYSLYLNMVLLVYSDYSGRVRQTGFEIIHGAITRADVEEKQLAFVFTGDEHADGAEKIISALNLHSIKASFFFTGRFYRNAAFKANIRKLVRDGHYLGAHSDKHLLYCDWNLRDSLLVTKQVFIKDLENNYHEMRRFGIKKTDARYFLPPYEWYNDSISVWTAELGLQLINHTHGTLSHADYTVPKMINYRGSKEIFDSILSYESSHENGLNGFILLVHIGTAPERTDKFYEYLESLILELKSRGYTFKRVNELLDQ